MVKLVKKVIEEKRRKTSLGLAGPAPKDVIDVLLSDKSGQLTDELISDNVIDLMIPAEDSVPVLITLAVKYLSSCPIALHQLEVLSFLRKKLLFFQYFYFKTFEIMEIIN